MGRGDCLAVFLVAESPCLVSDILRVSGSVSVMGWPCLISAPYFAKAVYIQLGTSWLVCQLSSPGPFCNFSIPSIVPSLH